MFMCILYIVWYSILFLSLRNSAFSFSSRCVSMKWYWNFQLAIFLHFDVASLLIYVRVNQNVLWWRRYAASKDAFFYRLNVFVVLVAIASSVKILCILLCAHVQYFTMEEMNFSFDYNNTLRSKSIGNVPKSLYQQNYELLISIELNQQNWNLWTFFCRYSSYYLLDTSVNEKSWKNAENPK